MIAGTVVQHCAQSRGGSARRIAGRDCARAEVVL